MPAPVELALASLLPTVSFLPTDLIVLANSLLSQSRAKAASLNRDEEIARTYACCHIACKRLEKRLDLDIGKAVPPVAPRVYNKLYGYLDGVLGRVKTPVKGTPGKAVGSGRGGGDGTPSKKTPATVKDKPVVKTPNTATLAESKRPREEPVEGDDVQDFAMPLIRSVCKAIRVPSAAPHVLVGASAAVKELRERTAKRQDGSSKKRRKTPQSAKSVRSNKLEKEEDGKNEPIVATNKWPALLLALCLLTAEKMTTERDEKEMRTEAINGAKDFCKQEKVIGADLRSIGKDMDFYRLEAEESWLEMEWFANVPEDVISAEAQAEDLDEDESMDEDDDEPLTPKRRPCKTPLRRKEKHGGKAADGDDVPGAAGLLSGLATMFQPAVDWLSEERRRDYAQWKKGIMKEMIAVEQQAAQQQLIETN